MRCGGALAALAALAALVREGEAHARLVCPAPRSPNANKNVGCGADAAVKGPVTVFAPGPNTITFDEFIMHPGAPFRIALSTSGAVTQAAFDTCILLNHVPHSSDVVPGTAGKYSITVDIPDIACNGCVLQLIQIMTDKLTKPSCVFDGNAPGGAGGDCFSNYFSCADIRITGKQPAAGFVCPKEPAAWAYGALPAFVYDKGFDRTWQVDANRVRTLRPQQPSEQQFAELVGTCASAANLALAVNPGLTPSPVAAPTPPTAPTVPAPTSAPVPSAAPAPVPAPGGPGAGAGTADTGAAASGGGMAAAVFGGLAGAAAIGGAYVLVSRKLRVGASERVTGTAATVAAAPGGKLAWEDKDTGASSSSRKKTPELPPL